MFWEIQPSGYGYSANSYASVSNLDRFGPAITPTAAKRRRDTTPIIVAERLPPPKEMVKNDSRKTNMNPLGII